MVVPTGTRSSSGCFPSGQPFPIHAACAYS